MKTLRIILSVALLFIFVCVLGLGALFFFMDPNKLKPVIAEEVKKKSGYTLQIDGQLSWSLYPRIGVKVDHLILYSPKQSVPFMELQNVIFVTELTELLHGRQVFRGDIYIANVKLASAVATNAHVGLNWKAGTLFLSPIHASFYQGIVYGDAQGVALSTFPHWEWNIQFKNVDIKSALQDLNGKDSKLSITGSANLTFQAQTQGKTREQVLSNMNGAFVYTIVNGALEGVDLNYYVSSAEAILKKQPLTLPTTATNQTPFDDLSGAATIKNGVAEVNTLTLTTGSVVTKAHGAINLPYQAINLQLQIAPKNAKSELVVPVMLTGSLTRPDIRLDMTELKVLVAKQDLDSVKEKVTKEIGRHLPAETAQTIGNLLGH